MTRIVLLFIVLVGLTLLALQNLSPVLSLVFLGSKTLALPLAAWMVVAIAAGFLTSILIGGIFQLSNYLFEKEWRTANADSTRQREANPSSPRQPSGNASSSQSFNTNDYEEDEDEEESVDEAAGYPQDSSKDHAVYERPQEPTTRYQSGSVYSYSYRQPSDSGVGKTEAVYRKTESVYDADYRIITPPYQAPKPVENDWESKSNTDDDDWGFDDDDDEFNSPDKKR